MTYPVMQNITTLDGILVYVANAVPLFTPVMLMGIWIAITMVTYFGTRKLSGQAEIITSMAGAGFFTFVIGIIMTLTFGIINSYTLAILIAILLISIILLFIPRSRD